MAIVMCEECEFVGYFQGDFDGLNSLGCPDCYGDLVEAIVVQCSECGAEFCIEGSECETDCPKCGEGLEIDYDVELAILMRVFGEGRSYRNAFTDMSNPLDEPVVRFLWGDIHPGGERDHQEDVPLTAAVTVPEASA